MLLLYVIALVTSIIPSAIIWVIGHFSRIKKEEIAIGIGPKIAGIRIGETAYLVRILLLGSYVKFDGDSYRNAPRWIRIAMPTTVLAIMYIIGIICVGGLENAVQIINNESQVLFNLNNSARELRNFSQTLSHDIVRSFGVVVLCMTFYDTLPMATTLTGGIVGAICGTDVKDSQSELVKTYNMVSILVTLAIIALCIFLIFKSFGFDA